MKYSTRTEKRKRGRPVDPATRRERVLVRLFPAERDAWEAAAKAAGHGLSTWIRWAGNRAAGVIDP